jgi:hypothetical protein
MDQIAGESRAWRFACVACHAPKPGEACRPDAHGAPTRHFERRTTGEQVVGVHPAQRIAE